MYEQFSPMRNENTGGEKIRKDVHFFAVTVRVQGYTTGVRGVKT